MRGLSPDDGAVFERLRDEAVRDRPALDADVRERILDAVRCRGARAAAAGRGSPRTWRFVMLAACLGLGCAAVAWRGGHGPAAGGRGRETEPATAGVTPLPGIDSLPTFDELGEDVAGGIGALAATVVGLPEWRDLAVAGLPALDVWRTERDDVGGWPVEGSAGRITPR